MCKVSFLKILIVLVVECMRKLHWCFLSCCHHIWYVCCFHFSCCHNIWYLCCFHFSCFHNMQLCVLFPFQMARTKTCAAKVLMSQRHHPSSSRSSSPTPTPALAKKSQTFNKVKFPNFRCSKIYEKYHSNWGIHGEREVRLLELVVRTQIRNMIRSRTDMLIPSLCLILTQTN